MTYEIECVDNCRIVRGDVPLRDMAALLQAWGEDGAVFMDQQLAAVLMASAVVGTVAALNALRRHCGMAASKTVDDAHPPGRAIP